MKRKITELEEKLINSGWCLTLKRYTGKNSEKTFCYEYHKIADLRNEGKTYNQIIKLNQKRSQIVSYGIANVNIEYLDDDELLFIRSLYLQLDFFIKGLSREEKKASVYDPTDNLPQPKLQPMTPEELDELNYEIQKLEGDK